MSISYANGSPYYGIIPVNVGTNPNDGTGDNLRNSFITTNTNMSSIVQFLFTSPSIPQLTVEANGAGGITANTITANNATVTGTLTANIVSDTINASSLTTTEQGIGSSVTWTATSMTANVTQVPIASVSTSTYRSATFTVQAVESLTPLFHISILHAICDDLSNASSIEFGNVNHGGEAATYAVDVLSNELRLLATPSSSNSTTFKVHIVAMTA